MILGILQARASSSRLPGKVLLPLAGAPMLARQIERLQRVTKWDRLILATSDRDEDDAVARVAEEAGIDCYRGSLDDVLDRFYQAALPFAPSHVVRVTGDCPLIDWEVIDRTIAFGVEGGFDYASNTLEPSWPDGLDVEIATFAALETAWREGTRPAEREHVTYFVTTRPERFRQGSLTQSTDQSGMRWTVDEPRDYRFAGAVYDALYPHNPAFTSADILALLRERPEIAALNADIDRNEGLAASLRAEGDATS